MAMPPLLSSPSAVIVCILCYLSAITTLAATPAFSFQSSPASPPGRIIPPRSRGGGERRRPSGNAFLGIMGATASRGGGGDGADPPPRPSESARRAYRGKTILITGASRGLGRSIAIALASSCDPSLLILSGRDEGALAGVGGECERAMIAAAGDGRRRANALSDDDDDDQDDDDDDQDDDDGGGARRVEIVVCDLADGASVERLAAESLRLAASRRRAGRSPGGRDGAVVDVLINNGGVSSRSSFLETRIDVDEMVMRVNFHSGAALAKGLVPAMIGSGNGGGRVIWISSVQGKLGTPYRTSYAASKFAVQGYCESLRSELASGGVSVHVVSPGYVRTDLSLSAVMGDGRSYSKMDETTANGADPNEVAVSILDSVAAGKSDIVVAATFSARVAMWLKFLAPSILDRILAKRFEKQRVALKKIE